MLRAKINAQTNAEQRLGTELKSLKPPTYLSVFYYRTWSKKCFSSSNECLPIEALEVATHYPPRKKSQLKVVGCCTLHLINLVGPIIDAHCFCGM